MDDADRARKFQEQDLQRALDSRPAHSPLPRTGRCHWCDEDVGPEQVYCDQWCESDHLKRMEIDARG